MGEVLWGVAVTLSSLGIEGIVPLLVFGAGVTLMKSNGTASPIEPIDSVINAQVQPLVSNIASSVSPKLLTLPVISPYLTNPGHYVTTTALIYLGLWAYWWLRNRFMTPHLTPHYKHVLPQSLHSKALKWVFSSIIK